jgi:PAS domain S-box-containing protein
MCAGLLTVFSLVLLSLRPNAPDWVSMVAANAVLVFASILHFEGARRFRGLAPRRWLAYLGGIVTLGALTYFLYVVPNLNARAAVMSIFLGAIFLFGSITMFRAIPATHRVGLRLMGTLFALCAATHLIRAAYSAFGPPLGDLFALSGINGALFLALSVQISLFPIGFILLSDERAIADLKDAKEQAWGLQDSLRKSEERLRLAMSSGTIGVWDWDVSSNRITVSPEVERIYGVDVTNLRSYEDFAARVHPDDLRAAESERHAAIQNHQPFDTEFRIILPSGEIRWIATKGQAYYGKNGHVVRVVGNNIDITERKRLELALRESERKLREALKVGHMGYLDWNLVTNEIQWSPETYLLF